MQPDCKLIHVSKLAKAIRAFLYGWTGDSAIGTENTTIALFWT